MKLKSLFLTSMLSLLFISGVFAQDKYEYAMIRLFAPYKGTFIANNLTLTVSTHDKTTDLPLDKSERFASIIKQVEEMEAGGWEVFNTMEGLLIRERFLLITSAKRKTNNQIIIHK